MAAPDGYTALEYHVKTIQFDAIGRVPAPSLLFCLAKYFCRVTNRISEVLTSETDLGSRVSLTARDQSMISTI